ncbi:MAG: hypothetical protein QOF58_8103 [Pseudonocardiales bacterium]|nr:hypothetical protein [Pseudonocardiales bacterium]
MSVPVPLDRLVGRERELARLSELRRTARLITVRGPGGAGKTRLAQEYAAQTRGAYWVELAALTDPALPLPAIAAAMGVSEQAGRLLLDTVATALSGRRALLVLDNCEHLVDALARLIGALLARCADLTVLTTSREALDVPGEAVLPLGALSLSDATRLFAERAGAAGGFTLTEDNTPIVADICHRLDGHPLSIELAARRIRILGASGIRRLLDDRFRLLASRRGHDRHRDLRTAIGWSYDLLDAEEQVVFRRLSVLSGGFGLAAASAAAGFDVLDLVNALEAKSLLVATGPGRFRQLESIRLFAHDHLVEAGELGTTRQRVLDWLTGLADRYARQVFPTMEVLGSLDAERDTLLSTLDWKHDRKLLLTAALAACWRERGQFGPGRMLLDTALDATSPAEHRSTALAQAAVLATDVGDGARARELATEAVALDQSQPIRLARSTSRLAGACLTAGDAESATAHARDALALARRHGSPFDIAVCLHNVAYIVLHAGEPAEAADLLAECLPVCRARPEPWLRVGALHSAGTLALVQHNLDEAEAYFREALRFATNHAARKIHSIEGLAVVAAHRADSGRALRLGAASAELRRQWGMDARDDPWDRRVSTAISQARAATTRSATARAETEGAAMDAEQLMAYVLSDGTDSPLTVREREVVQLVAGGCSTRQIAVRLRIAERTVEAHLDNVRDKLDLRTRTQLAAWWVRHH